MLNYLVEPQGAKWSIRRTCVDIPGRAYALQLLDNTSKALPGIVGFYAESIDDAKARLGIK